MLPMAPSPEARGSAATFVAMAGSIQSTAHELEVIADNVAQYRERVAALAEAHVGTDRDDFVGAIHEAERQIRVAERGLRRAIRTAS